MQSPYMYCNLSEAIPSMRRRASGSRSRRQASDKLLLPALQHPGNKNNQRDAGDVNVQWDGRHRRPRRRKCQSERELLPQLAYVYLPPMLHEFQRHHRGRHRQRYSSSSSTSMEEEQSSDEDYDRVLSVSIGIRSQRMRSLAVMSKLQHDAATKIQHEYRFYRRRRASRNRRNQRLTQQARDFLDVFLLQELTNLLSVCLLEVLRETRWQDAVIAKRKRDLAVSLAESVLMSSIDECIQDVFRDALHDIVKSYMAQRLDLSRAATSPAVAVASDVFNDWMKEIVTDLLPEVLVELADEYTKRQQHELIWETLLLHELQSVAVDVISSVRATCASQQDKQIQSTNNTSPSS